MFPKYDVPPNCGPLVQGEILADIYEHRPLYPPMVAPEGIEILFHPIHHRLMVVMNPICDLDWDFKSRFEGGPIEQRDLSQNDDLSPLVPHVLLCDAYERTAIRPRFQGRDLWDSIEENKNERYHHFKSAPIGEPQVGNLPDLYLDFKKVIAIPCSGLYEALRQNGIKRVAVVPAIHSHDLMHRFYGFWSRVGLPTPSLIGYELAPTNAQAGDTITFTYIISNVYLIPRSIRLQASIEISTGYFADDSTNDVVVSILPGISTKSRNYSIPTTTTPGTYGVRWGIWSDAPGNSVCYEQAKRPEYLKIEPHT